MTRIITRCTQLALIFSAATIQGNIHEFANDSNLPIHVSLRYYAYSGSAPKKRIEPHTSYRFETSKQLKGIDIRDADKNKFIMSPGVYNKKKDSVKGFQVIGNNNTSWRFTIDQNTRKGRLTLLEGGRFVPQQGAPFKCPTADHNNCTVEDKLP